ncbi:MAG: co-chaperone GroES [Planctomycetota bacterium]
MATRTKKKIGIRPLHDKLIVRRDEAETQTAAGIFLPESSSERPKTGIVEAVGDGTLNMETGERVPLTIEVGQRIIFSSYSGTEVKLDGDELLVLSEADVLAIVED